MRTKIKATDKLSAKMCAEQLPFLNLLLHIRCLYQSVTKFTNAVNGCTLTQVGINWVKEIN
jgi:hypothetical protein